MHPHMVNIQQSNQLVVHSNQQDMDNNQYNYHLDWLMNSVQQDILYNFPEDQLDLMYQPNMGNLYYLHYHLIHKVHQNHRDNHPYKRIVSHKWRLVMR